MTEKPNQFNKKIAIIGFKNINLTNINTFLDQFRKKNKMPIQFFDAKNVAGPHHLYFAAINAMNAFEKETNISNNMAIEILLYASAQRQIKKAVKMLGIKQHSSEIAVLIIPEKEQKKEDYINRISNTISGERDDSVLELTNKKIKKIKKLFEISDIEFNAKLKKKGLEKETLTDLIIERMALVVTKG